MQRKHAEQEKDTLERKEEKDGMSILRKRQEKDNFCGHCGKKLKTDCNCWIKKGSYNCGEDSCPGYELLVKEVKM